MICVLLGKFVHNSQQMKSNISESISEQSVQQRLKSIFVLTKRPPRLRTNYVDLFQRPTYFLKNKGKKMSLTNVDEKFQKEAIGLIMQLHYTRSDPSCLVFCRQTTSTITNQIKKLQRQFLSNGIQKQYNITSKHTVSNFIYHTSGPDLLLNIVKI